IAREPMRGRETLAVPLHLVGAEELRAQRRRFAAIPPGREGARQACRELAQAHALRGRSIVKTQPCPGMSRTDSVPPHASTPRRLSESPSPTPLPWPPPCAKGSNIFDCTPG